MSDMIETPRQTKDTQPALEGRAGQAWVIDQEALRRRTGQPLDARAEAAALPNWIVHAPAAHPLWSHYLIGCIPLRDLPGLPPAFIHLDGATHEVIVYAMDPEHQPEIDGVPYLLTPVNFVGQFIADSDEAAAQRVQAAVQEIVDGVLSPDTDARSEWVRRFSGSNLRPGALVPDTIETAPDGSLLVRGTGARVMRELEHLDQTLRADESKPQ